MEPCTDLNDIDDSYWFGVFLGGGIRSDCTSKEVMHRPLFFFLPWHRYLLKHVQMYARIRWFYSTDAMSELANTMSPKSRVVMNQYVLFDCIVPNSIVKHCPLESRGCGRTSLCCQTTQMWFLCMLSLVSNHIY